MKYQGHESWTAWNVSLWISNDEGLYTLARRCIRRAANKEEAASIMLHELQDTGLFHTPDGARYSKNSIRKALRGV
mgnify:CR=1 FL=1